MKVAASHRHNTSHWGSLKNKHGGNYHALGELKVRLAKSLPILLILAVSLLQANIVRADVFQITGHVYDAGGKPIEGVWVEAFTLVEPWVSYGFVKTDAAGHYLLSVERPKRLNFPASSPTGRPIYEGCQVSTGWGSDKWIPRTSYVITENASSIEQDFVLRPAGVVRIRAYLPNGDVVERFDVGPITEWRLYPVYATDLGWRVVPSMFDSGRATIILSLNASSVINFPWEVPGFGRVILRADNGGKGFTLERQGEAIEINLNYELARTEFRLLNDSYSRYVREGYAFPTETGAGVESAHEFLQKASLTGMESKRAHFAELCLNRTLWTAESLELERAHQDIDKYRKGDATLQVVDENGKPLENADVTIAQTSHDFMFGASLDQIRQLDLYELLRSAGTNLALISVYWSETEPSLGHYNLDPWPTLGLASLKDKGIRVGTEILVNLERGPETWDTGLISLNYDQLKAKIHEHASKVTLHYADYVDYWIVTGNSNFAENSLGFTMEQNLELIRIAVAAVRSADPTAEVLLKFDQPCGWSVGPDYVGLEEFPVDPFTYVSRLNQYGIDHDGIALSFKYGSLWETGPGTFENMGLGVAAHPFRDLGSISRLLDSYVALSEPIHITEFNSPSNFTSDWGYWHNRSWNEELKTEWIKEFYTIAFSKPMMREITYNNVIDETFQEAGQGLLEADYSPKRSFYALKQLVTEDWTTHLKVKTDTNGRVSFRGFGGDYNIAVSTGNLWKNFTIHVNEQESKSLQIIFDRNQVLKEMQAEKAKLANNARSVLLELDHIRQWLETINPNKSAEIMNTINDLSSRYREGQYAQVVALGKPLIEDPLGIRLNGKLSDFQNFSATIRDPQGDLAANSLPGTDLTAVYTFADSSDLYIGVRVQGDSPNRNANYELEIDTSLRRYRLSVWTDGTRHGCNGWRHPYSTGGVEFECRYALGEIVEMRVPLAHLDYSGVVYLNNVWICQENPKRDFDSYDGPVVKIPNLRSFNATTALQIQTTVLTTTVSPSSEAMTIELQGSPPYIVAVSGFVILSIIAVYWRRRRVQQSRKP